jgi:hypothetical protein
MASIIEIDGKWRVQIRRKGVQPQTRTFGTQQDAEEFAKNEERRIALLKRGVLVDPLQRPTVYQVAGCYGLYRGLELQYIGRSVHIYRRLNDHFRGDCDWDSFRIWPCAGAIEAARLEKKLIRDLKPPRNVSMVEHLA